MADTKQAIKISEELANAATDAAKGVEKATDLASDLKNAEKSAFESLKYAQEYGIDSYKNLRKKLKQLKVDVKNLGIEVHHLIEKRFADLFGVKKADIPSVALTKDEHRVFTNEWRTEIPYGAGTKSATANTVNDSANEIYESYGEILNALEDFFD